jgi:GAF domain-containing protein
MATDDAALRGMLGRLGAVEPSNQDAGEGLRTVVHVTSTFFEGVAGAGLMMMGPDGLQAAIASDHAGQALEEAQERIGEGPCVDALIYDTVIRCTDLAQDDRYSALAPHVVPLGVRAVLGMPIHVSGAAAATLNVYGNEPRDWHDDVMTAMHAFAEVVGAMLTSAVRANQRAVVVDQLEYALANRVAIERATGVTMAQHGVDAVTAFNILRTQARSSRRKVADVAAELLAGLG